VFIRKKKNKSGLISVQVIDTSGPLDRLVKTIGSSRDPEKVKMLLQQARAFINQLSHQQQISFEYPEDKTFLKSLRNGIKKIQVIGPELILGRLFDQIGFNQIKDDLFRHLVISRLVFPLSKLKTSEYLMRYQNIIIDADQIYRYLDKLEYQQKEKVQQISFNHTLGLFEGRITIVFYDVTTLYFEASDEDDLRKTGFSKDGKHQQPQIVLGLLVSLYGYPLAYEIFEGNTFEGHTMLGIVEAFKAKYQINHLVVIADAGLMSKENISHLISKGYEFIIGGRIKNETNKIKQVILSKRFKEGQSIVIRRDDSTRLVVSYSSARARKDLKNRQKGLNKLEKALNKGRLNKQHINNRGYNKYLKLEGEVKITIDYQKFEADNIWDGLKGYITNCRSDKKTIIDNYKHLWLIEKAFRISKTDLKIRPIYHRLPNRISAHITIAFCAYKLFKELERMLIEKKTDISPEKALDLMRTIYQIQVKLPKSSRYGNIIFAAEEIQHELLNLFNIKIISD
jgi:transposase